MFHHQIIQQQKQVNLKNLLTFINIKLDQFLGVPHQGYLRERSKSSQSIALKTSPCPSPLPPRADRSSGMQLYDNLYRTSKSRQSAGSVGTYDTVYVRERRGGLMDCSRDVRSNSHSSYHFDTFNNNENNSSEI